MTLPTVSAEQREKALDAARLARHQRSELLVSIRLGTVSLADVLGREDPIAKKTRVIQVVRALPGVGPRRAQALLQAAGIPDGRRVGGVGERQREKLIEAAGL